MSNVKVMPPVKFVPGVQPFDPTRAYLEFAPYVGSSLEPKSAWSWNNRQPPNGWGIYYNNAIGDCAIAGAGHAEDLWAYTFLDPSVILTTYEDATGYDPNAEPDENGQNPTDKGTNLADFLGYWRTHGMGGHKIAAYAHIDPDNTRVVKLAIELFGCVYIGVDLPSSAEQQFADGQPWTVVDGDSIVGGHCVLPIAYDEDYVYVVTWAQVQPVAWSWWETYVSEVWLPVTQEWVGANGESPEGIDVAGLNADFKSLTGNNGPFREATPSPTPSPAPTPAPVASGGLLGWLTRLWHRIFG